MKKGLRDFYKKVSDKTHAAPIILRTNNDELVRLCGYQPSRVRRYWK